MPRMRISAIALLGLVCTPCVQAEIMRCESSLVDVGDSAGYVLEKCGEPESKTTVNAPVWARDVNGNLYQAGTTQAEIWRYTFGSGKFPALVKIEDGVVREIKFEKERS